MSTSRIAIRVPSEVVREARRAVKAKRARSVSAYFTEAARRRGKADALEALLSELDAEHGKPSSEAYAWARSVLEI